MRLLFLSRWFPYPPDNGSKLRVFGLLQALCQTHDVTLVSFVDPAGLTGTPQVTGPQPVKIQLCPYREYRPGSARALAGLFGATPRFLVDTYNPMMSRMIREAAAPECCDIVVASELGMAAYHRSFRGIPAIFDDLELGIYRDVDATGGSSLGGLRRGLTWQKHRRFVARLLPRFAYCTVVSDVERRIVTEVAPAFDRVRVIPNCLSADPPGVGGTSRRPNSLIFTGSLRYGPNREGMEWFVRQVFPRVQAEVGSVRVSITGDPGTSTPSPRDGVVLTGRVPDVRTLLREAAASVAPIFSGSGTRLKILEAMATGTPIVATSKAAEGLDVRHGEHILLADGVREFADAVVGVLREPLMALDMADRARKLFTRRYDSTVVLPQFLQLVDEAAKAPVKTSLRQGSAA